MIEIDGQQFDYDALSDVAKGNLASLQFCDNELSALQKQIRAIEVARARYGMALKQELENSAINTPDPIQQNIIPENSAEKETQELNSVKKKGLFGLFSK